MDFCGVSFAGQLRLPDEYFTEDGKPLGHLLRSRLSAHPNISWKADEICPKDDAGRAPISPLADSTSAKDYGAELQELCRLVKELTKLQAVANTKLDAALTGGPVCGAV